MPPKVPGRGRLGQTCELTIPQSVGYGLPFCPGPECPGPLRLGVHHRGARPACGPLGSAGEQKIFWLNPLRATSGLRLHPQKLAQWSALDRTARGRSGTWIGRRGRGEQLRATDPPWGGMEQTQRGRHNRGRLPSDGDGTDGGQGWVSPGARQGCGCSDPGWECSTDRPLGGQGWIRPGAGQGGGPGRERPADSPLGGQHEAAPEPAKVVALDESGPQTVLSEDKAKSAPDRAKVVAPGRERPADSPLEGQGWICPGARQGGGSRRERPADSPLGGRTWSCPWSRPR